MNIKYDSKTYLSWVLGFIFCLIIVTTIFVIISSYINYVNIEIKECQGLGYDGVKFIKSDNPFKLNVKCSNFEKDPEDLDG